MRKLASLALAAGIVFCLSAFPALADTAPTAAAVSSPSSHVLIEWGDAVAYYIVPLVTAALAAGGGLGAIVIVLIRRVFGAPAADLAQSLGVQTIIDSSVHAALADVPGAVAGKELDLGHLSPVVGTAITNAQKIAPGIITYFGGMDAAEVFVKAQMSRLGLVPASASAASFAAGPAPAGG